MTARFIISPDQAFAKEVDSGGGGEGGERLSMQMIKNFTPANNILYFCHQSFTGLNMLHIFSVSNNIIVPISFRMLLMHIKLNGTF